MSPYTLGASTYQTFWTQSRLSPIMKNTEHHISNIVITNDLIFPYI